MGKPVVAMIQREYWLFSGCIERTGGQYKNWLLFE